MSIFDATLAFMYLFKTGNDVIYFLLAPPPLSSSCTIFSVLHLLFLPAGLSEWLADTDLEKISALPAKLSSVHHKVVMETAPEGNQYPGAASTPSHLTYRVDRPFLYLIRDEASGALLFIGRVVNPKTLTM